MSHIDPKLKKTRRIASFGLAFVILVLLAIFLFGGFSLFLKSGPHTVAQEISFSQLVNDVEAGRIHDILIRGSEIHGTFNDGHKFQTYAPTDPMLLQRLYNKGVSITTQP
jgi:cell division protease FtsH